MSERHDPSACRRILRDAKRHGLSRRLLDDAQDLRIGPYRAEAIAGLCASPEMGAEDRVAWVEEIVSAMLEEERAWRLAECIGIIAKTASNWPRGAAQRALIEDLVGMTGGLPEGEARAEAIKALVRRVPSHRLPELLMLAIENHGMEAKAARPVLRMIVESGDDEMVEMTLTSLTDADPDLAVKLLDIMHVAATKQRRTLQPSALELALPMLLEADVETARILCTHAASLDEVRLLMDALVDEDEEGIRFTTTLAGAADRCGDAALARDLLEQALTHLPSLDEAVAAKIQKNISKGFARLGDEERAAELAPAFTPREGVEAPVATVGKKGHVIALVDTYEGALGMAHFRAVARASGVAWGFGLDIALVGWPTDDLAALCARTRVESRTDGVEHLDDLRLRDRIHLISLEEYLAGTVGHPVATTQNPKGGSVDLATLPAPLCLAMGLGRKGLPKRLLDACPDQFELTGIGAGLETAVAMGAIAARLAAL